MRYITESEFEERFAPFENPRHEGMRHFEDDDGDAAFFALLPITHVWTQITTGLSGGGWEITYVPGRGSGDGPIVALIPWTDDDADLIVQVETHEPEEE